MRKIQTPLPPPPRICVGNCQYSMSLFCWRWIHVEEGFEFETTKKNGSIRTLIFWVYFGEVEETLKSSSFLYRGILQKFGQNLLTVHEQLTVSRYFGALTVSLELSTSSDKNYTCIDQTWGFHGFVSLDWNKAVVHYSDLNMNGAYIQYQDFKENHAGIFLARKPRQQFRALSLWTEHDSHLLCRRKDVAPLETINAFIT